MSSYYEFSKAKFEYELKGILIRNKLGNFYDITSTLVERGFPVKERVYLIPTKNKSVSILIYSSIDIRTDRVREKGSDAVRIVMAWKTKNDNLYKSLGKRLRTHGIFKNLEKTILEAYKDIYNLKPWEFSRDMNL